MSSDTSRQVALASTACQAAAVRTHESKRADRLFDDPWANAYAKQALIHSSARYGSLRVFCAIYPTHLPCTLFDVITTLSTSESRRGFNIINNDLLTSPKSRPPD